MNDTVLFNALAQAMQKGDTHAAERLFDHFAPAFHSFFMARIGNRETAQDLTQEVFLKVIQHIDQFDQATGNFTPWIWQIARNAGTDYYRQKRPAYLAELPDEGENFTDDTARVDDSAKMREIMKVVAQLPEEEQELFQMHFITDMSYAGIAAATNKSEPALRVAIHRLRKKITPLLK